MGQNHWKPVRSAAGGQHGFYAEALRAHLGSLATGLGLGTISGSPDTVRFV